MNEDQQLTWDILRTPDDIDFTTFRKMHKKAWLTKERKLILMSSMETGHIISCINMLERLEQQTTLAYEGLVEELIKRGEQYVNSIQGLDR